MTRYVAKIATAATRPRNDNLMQKTAIITGASRGIGKAVALALAENGYRLCLIARTEKTLQTLADTIISQYQLTPEQYPLVYAVDVINAMSVKNAITDTTQKTGRIDVLFNNAGILEYGTSELSPDKFTELVNINLIGAFNVLHAAIPSMKQQRQGYIFNVASIIGKQGSVDAGGYSASKFGLAGLSESLYKELAHFNIKVTTICPGVVDTKMSNNITWLSAQEKIQIADIVNFVRYALTLSPAACIPEIIIDCMRVVAEGFK